MEIRTYRAKSLGEALQKIRAELGPEAMIVQSREVETGWWDRVSRGRRFEIRAQQASFRQAGRAHPNQADDPNNALPLGMKPGMTRRLESMRDESETGLDVPAPVASRLPMSSLNSDVQTMELEPRPHHAEAPEPPALSAAAHLNLDATSSDADAILRANRLLSSTDAELFGLPVQEHLQQRTRQVGRDTTSPLEDNADGHALAAAPHALETDAHTSRTSTLFELVTELVEADVPPDTARQLVDSVSESTRPIGLDSLRERLIQFLAEDVKTTGPIDLSEGSQNVIALVGPTGVGKTTTIAKLAANLRLCERRRVGLITVDTFRVAAVDQLRTYAEIMDLPMAVVTTPREMRDALTRLSDEDVILIDTAGRSPADAIHLQQLKSMLNEAAPQEIQLVISCTDSARHLRHVVEGFLPLGCSSLLATKLDEVTTLGNLVPLALDYRLPFSYLTCGQNVPDDIVLADSPSLLKAMLAHQPISTLV